MPTSKPQKFLIGSIMYVLFFAGSAETIGGHDKDEKCGGEERWPQKVLIDKEAADIPHSFQESTIAQLTQIDTKTPQNRYREGKPRMEIEKHIYKIKDCFITDVLRENDNDLHLVIEDGKGNHMIAEIPDPQCPEAEKSDWSSNFEACRKLMLKYGNNYRHYLFTLTGVLFVDKAHGQTGIAPNSVELHPLLEMKVEKKINPIAK
jgi:hypothetical protein